MNSSHAGEMGLDPGDLFPGDGTSTMPETLVRELESLLIRVDDAIRKIPIIRNGNEFELPTAAKTVNKAFPNRS